MSLETLVLAYRACCDLTTALAATDACNVADAAAADAETGVRLYRAAATAWLDASDTEIRAGGQDTAHMYQHIAAAYTRAAAYASWVAGGGDEAPADAGEDDAVVAAELVAELVAR